MAKETCPNVSITTTTMSVPVACPSYDREQWKCVMERRGVQKCVKKRAKSGAKARICVLKVFSAAALLICAKSVKVFGGRAAWVFEFLKRWCALEPVFHWHWHWLTHHWHHTDLLKKSGGSAVRKKCAQKVERVRARACVKRAWWGGGSGSARRSPKTHHHSR